MSKLKRLDGLFAGGHFDRDVIILCVRWYLHYKLSLRDLVASKGSQSVFSQGHQASAPVAEDHHARWLCGFASRRARDEGRAPAA
ncbi:hypothetical protein [Paraburkholderia madseniana]|uniref:hypothetical protein n=1 Tax=Paraburkholderia madseniana TaxID=2599607 RepID=UPI0039C9C84F